MIATQARNASLEDMVNMLRVQHDAKNDAVVPAEAITSFATYGEAFNLEVAGMGPDGPGGNSGQFTATEIFDEHLADKLGIPLAYLRKLRAERPDMLDDNVNGWISGNDYEEVQPDKRKFFVRTFTDPDGGPGIARGLLSDTYRAIDNLDVLMSALDGIRAAGVDAEVEKCQISERRMAVEVVCPSIGVVASELLRNYRSPFDSDAPPEIAGGWTLERARAAAAREHQGYEPGDEPMMWAGFQITNSELGGGAFTLTPRVVLSPCRNGLVIKADMARRVHLGAKLEEGKINWSEETQAANLKLITSMTTDAIAGWLNLDYLTAQLNAISAMDHVIDRPAAEAVQLVGTTLKYSEEVQNGILEHFIRGGQLTSMGIVNAITSYAQCVESPDLAYELENSALDALALV